MLYRVLILVICFGVALNALVFWPEIQVIAGWLVRGRRAD